MKLLNNVARKLSLTKAEITLITALLLFLVAGIVLQNMQTVERRDTLIKKAERAQYREADVDSLLLAAKADEATLNDDVARDASEDHSNTPSKKRSATHAPAKKEFHGTIAFNKATLAQLQQVPGVGAVMAERLLSFRASKGGKVHDVQELLAVKGIGEKKLELLKPYFTFD